MTLSLQYFLYQQHIAQSPGSTWSAAVPLGSLTAGTFTVPARGKQKAFEIGFCVKSTPGPYRLSRTIVFAPRFFLVKELSRPTLCLACLACSARLTCLAGLPFCLVSDMRAEHVMPPTGEPSDAKQRGWLHNPCAELWSAHAHAHT